MVFANYRSTLVLTLTGLAVGAVAGIVFLSQSVLADIVVEVNPCTLGNSTINNGDEIRAYANNSRSCAVPANSIVRTCVAGTLDDSSGTGSFVHDTCVDSDLTFEAPITRGSKSELITATPGVPIQFEAVPVDLNKPIVSIGVGGAVSNDTESPVDLDRRFSYVYEISDGLDGAGTVERFGKTITVPGSAIKLPNDLRSHWFNGEYTFATAGTYSLRFCADQAITELNWFGDKINNLIPETDETNNCGPWTNISILLEPPDASTATLTPGTCNTGEIFIDWADVPNAASYSIYNATTDQWFGNSIGSNYTFTGLLDTNYQFYLRSNTTDGLQSANSSAISARTAAACAASGASLSATQCSIAESSNDCVATATWEFTNVTGSYSVVNTTTNEIISSSGIGASVPATLRFGVNTLEARANGVPFATYDAIATCAGGLGWDAATSLCALAQIPPAFTFNPERDIVRNGGTTTVAVIIDSSSQVQCTLRFVQETDIVFTHDGSTTPNQTYTYDTKPIFATQIMSIQCTDSVTGLSTDRETRVEVIPKFQEI